MLVGARCCHDRVVIEVRDNGKGIALDQQQRIFDEFVQLPRSDQRRPTGMGLGLSVRQRLRQLLEHPVTLHSRPGASTCFAVGARAQPRGSS
ncbi:ATP-binding protein [Halochromatium sp.]